MTFFRPSLAFVHDHFALVRQETLRALHAAGCRVHSLDAKTLTSDFLSRLLNSPAEKGGLTPKPELFLCINFQGLDKNGEIFSQLNRLDIPVVVWCVDNPWHLVSGIRDEFWKKCTLFVTDASFIPELKAHGAQKVHHLPLAADPDFFRPPLEAPSPASTVTFVGRSAFPEKERFFLGQEVPDKLLAKARNMLKAGERPNWAWWLEQLAIKRCWPGSECRRAGLGAEMSSVSWRTTCLEAALPHGLDIYGDPGWSSIAAQGARLHQPVDYYTHLAELYRKAPYSLNMTSMLLPAGLTQRHFDVWAAGGFLLTDSTPGLDLFPEELTGPVRFGKAEELAERISHFNMHPDEKERLRKEWQTLIRSEHTYAHRIRQMMDKL